MKIALIVATVVLVSATATAAFADPKPQQDHLDATEIAPRNALEIGIQAGYTQPFGDIEQNRAFADLVDAGGAVALELAYRANPHWSIGVAAQFHESEVDSSFVQDHDVRGLAATLQVTHHVLPFEEYDPFIAIGSGYRFLWIAPEGPEQNSLLHGLELVKVMVGIDFRKNQNVALGPVIGADMNLLLWEPGGMIEDPRPSTFVFAGLLGRFDVFGTREASDGTVVAGAPRTIDVAAH